MLCVYSKTYSWRESNSSEHVFILARFPVNYIWLRNIDGICTSGWKCLLTLFTAKILISLCEYTFASSTDGILHTFSVGFGHRKKLVDCPTPVSLFLHLFVVDMMMCFGQIIIIQANSDWAASKCHVPKCNSLRTVQVCFCTEFICAIIVYPVVHTWTCT